MLEIIVCITLIILAVSNGILAGILFFKTIKNMERPANDETKEIYNYEKLKSFSLTNYRFVFYDWKITDSKIYNYYSEKLFNEHNFPVEYKKVIKHKNYHGVFTIVEIPKHLENNFLDCMVELETRLNFITHGGYEEEYIRFFHDILEL